VAKGGVGNKIREKKKKQPKNLNSKVLKEGRKTGNEFEPNVRKRAKEPREVGQIV